MPATTAAGGGDTTNTNTAQSEPPQPEADNNNNNNNNNSNSNSNATILNINVGILGHVDSGKTSLVKALSTRLSTAALDKSRQSRDRGMTLDLGFSCFLTDLPAHLQRQKQQSQQQQQQQQQLQITLVDCPGHASLIRTIIGGAQIIDVALLVVDAFKGWQAQTTECLVLAQLTAPHLVVALNKIDLLLPESERAAKLRKVEQDVRRRLQVTPRFAGAPIVGVAACVGGEKVAAATTDTSAATTTTTTNAATLSETSSNNMDALVATLKDKLPVLPHRDSSGPFYFAIDHCFPIKGRGTVLTGTCLSGGASVNETVEFPDLALQRKIKSMQMFQRPCERIRQGDRAGLCVSNLDAATLERGIAASVGAVPLWRGAIACVRKVPYYSGNLRNQSKFHISVGHATVMATVSFWGARELLRQQQQQQQQQKNDAAGTAAATTMENEKSLKDSNSKNKKAKSELHSSSLGGDAEMAGLPRLAFDFNQDFLQQDGLLESLPPDEMLHSASGGGHADDSSSSSSSSLLHWALLDFQTPVHCPVHSLVIGSRLDAVDSSASSGGGGSASSRCRLAFSGRLIERIDPAKDAARVRLYAPKERRGVVSRLGDPHVRQDDGKTVRYEVFGTDLFKKETNMKLFIGMKLVTSSGDIGEIKSSFGTSGKFRVYFPAGTEAREGDPLILQFKRFAHDPEKAMHQDVRLPAARPGTRVEVEKKSKSKPKLEAGVHRTGQVASLKGDTLENGKQNMAIIAGFFAPEINIKEKAGTKVLIPGTGEVGSIVGPFGKAGKCKVSFEQGISAKAGDKAELQV